MTPEQWSEVKEVFSTALSLPLEARDSFLTRLEPALRQEVASLLRAHDDSEALEQPVITANGGLLGKALDASFEREQIGPYRTVAEIGRGGMGAVYRVARSGEEYKEYALKIIRPELNQQLLLARFQQELRILQKLRHPFIVGVLDAGSTEYGEPFFVMELVRGLPLDEHCDANMLSIKERLVLFQKVCEAVSAAHQLGVVHRDLKPSNVLVTDAGEPRLLDFGIAKVVKPENHTQTLLATETAQQLMTPEYASPEQIRGDPVSPRSDVYSLGVLLYELLTGFRPYVLTRKEPGAIARAIFEQLPARPSSRFSRFTTGGASAARGTNTEAEIASARRGTTPRLLRRNLKGKLDNIVMQCLAKSPDQRYQSVAEFSNDIRSYLAHQPVAARAEPLWNRAADVLRSRTALLVFAGTVSAVGVTIALRMEGKREYLDFSDSRLTALLSSSELEQQPVISPDGKRLAFVRTGNSEGHSHIYLSTSDGQAAEALTSGDADQGSPSWSPDGTRIAYVQTENGRPSIWKMAATAGATARRVAGLTSSANQDLGRSLEWSRNGRQLLVSDMSAAGSLAIFAVDAESGKRSQITRPPVDAIGDVSPRASPDGRRLAFIRTRNGGYSQVDVQALPSGEPRAIPFEAFWVTGLTWADSHSLIVSSATGANAGLWMISIDGLAPKRLPVSGIGMLDPFLSSDGKQLVYCRETYDDNIWRLNLATPSRATTESMVIDSPGLSAEPAISPDGKHIAFNSEISGSLQIWTSDLSGQQKRQVTSDPAWLPDWPSWSADGSRIVFSASSHSPYHLFVVAAQGGTPQRLTDDDTGTELEARWSRNGQSIFFDSRRNGQWQIWQVQPPAKTPRQLTFSGGKSPRESWDGRSVYYTKGAYHSPPRGPVQRSIWRVALPSGPEEKIVDIGSVPWGGWDVGPRGLYYIAGKPKATLYYYEFNSRQTSAVRQLGNVELDAESLNLSPDEHFLLYVKIAHLGRSIMSLRRE